MESKTTEPKDFLKVWFPHLLLFILLIISFGLFLMTLGPLKKPLFFAGALALLTYPILCEPIDKKFTQLKEKLSIRLYRNLIGIIATSLLTFICISPFIILLIQATGSVGSFISNLSGIFMGDETSINKVIETLNQQLLELQKRITNFPLPIENIKNEAHNFLSGLHEFNFTFMSFLISGTGNILVNAVITIVSLAFFYAHGGHILSKIFKLTPFSNEEISLLNKNYRSVIIRILNDTVLVALLNGITLATIVWYFTGLPFMILVYLTAFISLLPIVGVTVIWLPTASLLWTQGFYGQAISCALLCIGSSFFLSYFLKKTGKKFHIQSSWMSFMLFMSVIGGVLSMGIQGLILGPISITLINVLTRFSLDFYRSKGYREQSL